MEALYMSNIPADLRYSASHEWVRLEGAVATIGISDHAQESLSDVVYVELPSVGAVLAAGDKFGVVESVKAASDLYLPLSGRVIAVNDALNSDPAVVNSDPYGAGWMLRLEPSNLPAEWAGLLDAVAYEAVIANE
jgi:glycine cleavage system H protein